MMSSDLDVLVRYPESQWLVKLMSAKVWERSQVIVPYKFRS
jgi:hypothetical protein